MENSSKQSTLKVASAYDLEQKYNLSGISSLKKAVETNKNSLYKLNTELEEFSTSVVGNLEDIQNQIDGNITTFFESGVPDLDNFPAEEWTTDEEKNNHLGDLYYDKETGYAYRFCLDENVYKWLKLTDNDIAKALAIANNAKDTADNKRRVFTNTPSPPYDNGDLWINDDEIWVCQVSRDETEEYVETDFINNLKYTDDTYAIGVGENLTVLSGTVLEIKEGVDEMSTTLTRTVNLVDEQGETIGEIGQQTSELSQTTDGIKSEVSKKVGMDEIISSINQSSEEILIEASRIKLANFYVENNQLISDIISKYNYTIADVERALEIIVEENPTPEELEKYDFNNSGAIEMRDIICIQLIIASKLSYTNPGKFILNTNTDTQELLSVIKVLNGDNEEVVNIGFTNNKLPDLTISGNLDINGVTLEKKGEILKINNAVSTTNSFQLPKNATAGYGLTNTDGTSIIRDHNNGNVTIGATGGKLYLGYQNTSSLYFMSNKASMDSDGNITTPNLFYKKNDTVTISSQSCSAFITSSATQLFFSVVFPKSLDNISTVSITGGSIIARTTTGYLDGSSSSGISGTSTSYTWTVSNIQGNVVRIIMAKSTAFTGATNNTPATVNCMLTFKFT